MTGSSSQTDSRSEELTLGFAQSENLSYLHSTDSVVHDDSTAWLDNGSFAIRQPHTTNSTESRFSNQVRMTSQNFLTLGQGAIMRNHDWLFRF